MQVIVRSTLEAECKAKEVREGEQSASKGTVQHDLTNALPHDIPYVCSNDALLSWPCQDMVSGPLYNSIEDDYPLLALSP